MHEIVSLCKRRGFVFPSSEIYNGFAGFFDYGPLGTELKNNIKQAWWQDMVHKRDDVVGLDCAIISSPAVWQASGHVGGFSDPMVDCKESNLRWVFFFNLKRALSDSYLMMLGIGLTICILHLWWSRGRTKS
jgi:glycyl-tRNA synthetase